jgi:hypothetical protein
MKEVEKEFLQYEMDIVWVKEINVDYVIQKIAKAGTRQRSVPVKENDSNFTRFGYAKLCADAPNTGKPYTFYRRVFYLRDWDRWKTPDGLYASSAPSAAVDPRTVSPGEIGRKTQRVWSQ